MTNDAGNATGNDSFVQGLWSNISDTDISAQVLQSANGSLELTDTVVRPLTELTPISPPRHGVLSSALVTSSSMVDASSENIFQAVPLSGHDWEKTYVNPTRDTEFGPVEKPMGQTLQGFDYSTKTPEELMNEFFVPSDSSDQRKALKMALLNALYRRPEAFISLKKTIPADATYLLKPESSLLEELVNVQDLGPEYNLEGVGAIEEGGKSVSFGRIETADGLKFSGLITKAHPLLAWFVQSKPAGIGMITFPSDENGNEVQHLGSVDSDFKVQGSGYARVPGRGIYDGHFTDGCAQGVGRFFFEQGDYFEGQYENGHSIGKGTFTTRDGLRAISPRTFAGWFYDSTFVNLKKTKDQPDASPNNEKKIPKKQLDGSIDFLREGNTLKELPKFVKNKLNAHDDAHRRADGAYSIWQRTNEIEEYRNNQPMYRYKSDRLISLNGQVNPSLKDQTYTKTGNADEIALSDAQNKKKKK